MGPDPDEEVVLKPTTGVGGGKDVQFLRRKELPAKLAPLLVRGTVHDDWIVQRVVEQCLGLSELNADSVNTIRIITYRSFGGRVVHLSSVLRVGRTGSRVDNRESGGITCGIDDGGLNQVAHIKYDSYQSHPDSDLRFRGFAIPAWEEAVAACVSGHEAIPAMDLISWDISIDTSYCPTLIEFNTHQQGLEMHQLENGPLPAWVVSEWAQRADFVTLAGHVIRRPSSL